MRTLIDWLAALIVLAVLLGFLALLRGAPAPLPRHERPDGEAHPAALYGEWFMGWQTGGRGRDDPRCVAGYRVTLNPDGSYVCGRKDSPQFVGTWRAYKGWVYIREWNPVPYGGHPVGTVYDFSVPAPPIYEAKIGEGYYSNVTSWLARPHTKPTD